MVITVASDAKGNTTGYPSSLDRKLFGLVVTLWLTYKKLLNMAIEMLDLPIQHSDFP